MANTATITALIPTLFSSFQTVSREMVGAIRAVSTDFDDKGVAADGSSVVTVPVADTVASSTYTPAMTASDGAASTASATRWAVAAESVQPRWPWPVL